MTTDQRRIGPVLVAHCIICGAVLQTHDDGFTCAICRSHQQEPARHAPSQHEIDALVRAARGARPLLFLHREDTEYLALRHALEPFETQLAQPQDCAIMQTKGVER